ncbi:MAG TPA: 50S ribosomal protein L35 [bacterium]|jgi:large subunit ribosomal protein L35|nr:50S ribosomal protein L35 [bacterium]HNT65500.1 50S ribosomal protein L35 [bacterium]HOX87565.1 50S ribosomal protein L35 [bacterium]HPG47251.1 50S ribosomal protein L35 [bacterium]HPM99543.1 50S ribosomal protein L35 [bacterium]
MPKMKSNRAAAKRFHVTGSGRIRRYKSHGRHILTKKSQKRKRNLRKSAIVADSDARRVNRMILS